MIWCLWAYEVFVRWRQMTIKSQIETAAISFESIFYALVFAPFGHHLNLSFFLLLFLLFVILFALYAVIFYEISISATNNWNHSNTFSYIWFTKTHLNVSTYQLHFNFIAILHMSLHSFKILAKLNSQSFNTCPITITWAKYSKTIPFFCYQQFQFNQFPSNSGVSKAALFSRMSNCSLKFHYHFKSSQ